MTTPKQLASNRRNAARSTGPKTAVGRARSSKTLSVMGPIRQCPCCRAWNAEDWEAYRAGIIESLAPVGGLEEALADRVAVCSWRLDRAVRYETAVTTVSLEKVEEKIKANQDESALTTVLKELEERREVGNLCAGTLRLHEQLPGLPDEAVVAGDDVNGFLIDLADEQPETRHYFNPEEDKGFLSSLGVPKDELDEPFSWNAWTAGMVRQAVTKMAERFKTDPKRLLAKALEGRQEAQAGIKDEVRALEHRAKELRLREEMKKSWKVNELILPNSDILQKITRYEAHLSRQMLQALHELQRLQANRAGAPILPPAALDVTLDTGGVALEAFRDAATG